MSINLYCKEETLWQTPTYITNMCYSNNDGGWKGVKYRYIEWIRGQINGKDWAEIKELAEAHIRQLNTHKKLTFYTV